MKIIVRKPSEAEKKTAAAWPVWAKEASAFPWHYDDQETCYILEGAVTVEAGAEKASFGAGDWVVFPKGLDCRWTIQKAVRKHYKFG
ncbi:MAG: cupin domain-containing protein [Elusimicrobia bacterium]|nr:cupin domain-containing protein [Elusimicrobiota bacterium]